MSILSGLKSIFVSAAVFMLLTFSVTPNASAQAPICPDVPVPIGWINAIIGDGSADFNHILLGTFELTANDAVVGGLDWFWRTQPIVETLLSFTDPLFGDPLRGLETNLVGGQIISWFSLVNNRRSFIQVTNVATANFQNQVLCPDADGEGDPLCAATPPLSVHVQILDENCTEVLNFCDTYTPKDTHIYDLLDPIRNDGGLIFSGGLPGNEGTFVLTPVVDCDGQDNRAIEFQALQGSLRMFDSARGTFFEYGTNAYARRVIAFPYLGLNNEELAGETGNDDGEALFGCDIGEDTAEDLGFPGVGVEGGNFLGCCRDSVHEFIEGGGISEWSSEGGQALILDGGDRCRFEPTVATAFHHGFNVLADSQAARSDLVFLNFNDTYNNGVPLRGYRPQAGFTTLFPLCFDDVENQVSQTELTVCYASIGIQSDDGELPSSNIALPAPPPPATPTPAPTAAPTAAPTSTPTSSPDSGSGGGGGCAIAPLSASASFANILLTLIPALGIGIRAALRRKED